MRAYLSTLDLLFDILMWLALKLQLVNFYYEKDLSD